MGRRTLGASRGIAAATSAAATQQASTHTAAAPGRTTGQTFQQGLQSDNAVEVQGHLFSAPVGAKVHLTTNRPGQAHDVLTFTKQSDGKWAQRQQVFTSTASSHFVKHAPIGSAQMAILLKKRRKAGDVIEAQRGK